MLILTRRYKPINCIRINPCNLIGPTGPRGATGPTGPTGPTGTALPVELVGFQAQFTSEESITLEDNEPISFNNILNSTSSAISLVDDNTFVLNQAGNYLIIYDICCDGSTIAPWPTFALVPDFGTTIFTKPPINGQLITTSVLLNVTNVPTQFQIVNATGNDVFINADGVGANIVIAHLQTI